MEEWQWEEGTEGLEVLPFSDDNDGVSFLAGLIGVSRNSEVSCGVGGCEVLAYLLLCCLRVIHTHLWCHPARDKGRGEEGNGGRVRGGALDRSRGKLL